MVGVLFVLLLAIPIAELYVIVQAAQAIGVLNTLALLVAISVAGAWLLRQQGLQTWSRLQVTLARGEMPASEVVDGAMILLGGALLLTPGFLTDIVGIVLLLPPTRAVVKRSSRRLLGQWARRRFEVVQSGAGVHGTTVVRSRPSDRSANRSERPTLTEADLREDEADSRDN